MRGVHVHEALTCALAAAALLGATEASAQPKVYAGVYLHDVSEFDQRNGTFDVDAEVWAKWRGEFDPDHLQIANASDVDRTFLGTDSDGDWHSARWRLRGTLRGYFPLHRFPFDEQTLAVVLEMPVKRGRLAPDLASSGMAERFSLTDWLYEPRFRPAVSSTPLHSDLGDLALEGRRSTVRRVGFEVVMRRPIVPVALKIFVPLAIIMLVVIASLFVGPDQIEARGTMGATGLLTCVAFQLSVSDSLPAVTYLTLADTLFIVAYAVSSIVVVTTVVGHILHRRGRLHAALWLDRVLRPLLPLAAAAVVWSSTPAPQPQAEPEPEPLPAMDRHDSARDILRIGATSVSRISGSPPYYAAAWAPVYEDPAGERLPVFVDRVPGVDNEALQFGADGALEVRWRLREGLAWSDGAPVGAEDLRLPLEGRDIPQLAEVRTVDPRTVVLRWEERLARALEAPSVWPAHALGEIHAQDGYDGVRDHRRAHPTPVLGPYRITSFERGERLVADANPRFLGPPPNIPRVELIHFDDRQALADAFEAGGIDIVAPNNVTMEQLEQVARRRPEAAHVRPSAVFVFLHPDLSHPLLGQLEVRRALLQAIDRSRIAREVYGDAGRVAHVPGPGEPPKEAVVTDHDPDAARAGLERAGAAGTELTLRLSRSPVSAEVAALVAEDLEAAGVRVSLEPVDSTFSLWRERSHGGLLLHVIRGRRDAAPRRYWNLPIVEGSYDDDARHDAYTDEVDELVQREQRTLYPERRAQLRDALFGEYSRRLPSLPLVFAAERMLADPALRGWQAPPEVPFGRGMETWYFDP